MTRTIQLNKVSKVYSGKNRTNCLHNITHTIQPGSFVSIIGPSGCGKSTLLRLIGGITFAEKGILRIRGQTPQEALAHQECGFVFQNPVLMPWRTVQQNIELPLELISQKNKKKSPKAKDEVANLLRMIQLEEFKDHYPPELSGGMQQLVAIARALVFRPSILLMDEPFGALDEITRSRMQEELLRIWRKTKKTIVFVTHSIPEAVFLSDEVIVLSPRPGKVIANVAIEYKRPRTAAFKQTKTYFSYVNRLSKYLGEGV